MALKNPTGKPRYASIVFLVPELTGATIRRFNERQPSRFGIAAIPKLHGLAPSGGSITSISGHDEGWITLAPER
jgi:hypothetical protein